MAQYTRLDDGLDLRLIEKSNLKIGKQEDRRLEATWNVWQGALNSIGTCQGMIPFGMADVIAAILCNREGIVVTKDASCFYHKPLYIGPVETVATLDKKGKRSMICDVKFYQKGILTFQSTFTMYATLKTYDKEANSESYAG